MSLMEKRLIVYLAVFMLAVTFLGTGCASVKDQLGKVNNFVNSNAGTRIAVMSGYKIVLYEYMHNKYVDKASEKKLSELVEHKESFKIYVKMWRDVAKRGISKRQAAEKLKSIALEAALEDKVRKRFLDEALKPFFKRLIPDRRVLTETDCQFITDLLVATYDIYSITESDVREALKE